VLGAYLVLSRSGMLGSRKVNELPKDSIPPAS
jgi:hypothetical protein